MLLLASTSDLVQVVTTGTANTDVHASWVDISSGVITPSRTNTQISTATTTTVVGSPAGSTNRSVKLLYIRNSHTTDPQGITVQHTDGSTVVKMMGCTLAAGEVLCYDEADGWKCFSNAGEIKYHLA